MKEVVSEVFLKKSNNLKAVFLLEKFVNKVFVSLV